MSKCSKLTDQLVRHIIQRNSYFVYAIPENVLQVTDILDTTFLREVFANEVHRIRTFTSFPLDGVYPSYLAADGFIYQGNGYEAMCIYCGLKNASWNTGGDVRQIHGQLSPGCPVVTGVNVNNIRYHNVSSDRHEFEGIQYHRHIVADQEEEGELSTAIEDGVQNSQPEHFEQTIRNENDVALNPEDANRIVGLSPQEESSMEIRNTSVQNAESNVQHVNVSKESILALTATPTSIKNTLISSDTIATSSRSSERAQDVSLEAFRENQIKIYICKSIQSTDRSLESDNKVPILQDALTTSSSKISQAHGEFIVTLEEGQSISEITVSLDDNSDDALPTIKTSSELNNGNVYLRISCQPKRTGVNKMPKRQEKTELHKNGEALLIKNLRKDKPKLWKTLPDEDKQEVDIKNDPAVILLVAMGYKEEDVWRTATILIENSLPLSSDAILEMLKENLKHTMTKEQFQLSEAIRKIKESFFILQPMLQEFHPSH